MHIMFVPLARPTARRALRSPKRSAIQEYERVSPTGIERRSCHCAQIPLPKCQPFATILVRPMANLHTKPSIVTSAAAPGLPLVFGGCIYLLALNILAHVPLVRRCWLTARD